MSTIMNQRIGLVTTEISDAECLNQKTSHGLFLGPRVRALSSVGCFAVPFVAIVGVCEFSRRGKERKVGVQRI